jgi:hypothetical protein
VKLLNNQKLAQNVLKRLNKENETEPEPLNPGQPKLLNDKRAYNVTEREPRDAESGATETPQNDVAEETCLPSSCLKTTVSSGPTIG